MIRRARGTFPAVAPILLAISSSACGGIKIRDPKRITSSGFADVGYGDFVFRVSVEEYVKVVHSSMLP